MYQYGRGVPQNYGMAVYWYRRAAEQGNPAAQHLLGLMYDKGLGRPTDHVAAHIWLNLAASRTKGAEHEDNVRLRDAVGDQDGSASSPTRNISRSVWAPKPEPMTAQVSGFPCPCRAGS